MVRCSFCNHRNPAGVQRCGNCGAWLSQGAETAPPAAEARPPANVAGGDDLEQRLLALLRQGQKIAAIKVCREQTGWGLKEAKDFVEALAARNGVKATGAGCAGVIALALAACGLAIAL